MKRIEGRFAGKIVLVTGAGGGLGGDQAKQFAAEGAKVVLADIDERRGEELAEAIRGAGGRALFARIDVVSALGWLALAEHIKKQIGALHVLVNNAGIVSRVGISAIPLEEWQRVIDVNLTGPMLGIQAMAPLIRDSGGGAIVNISSTAGLIGHPGVAYSASKWGLRGVTKSAALDLLSWGVRVNSVHPAQVSDTRMTAGATPGWRRANERVMPAGRGATSREITRAVMFLASAEASYINATEIVVDGGATAIGLAHARNMIEQDFNRAGIS
jgi:3alpha(or 20beta)-hydroxysteroid dehydrogenase